MSDYTPFKMKGFSGFGNSPMKADTEEVKNPKPKELSSWDKAVNLAKHKETFMDPKHPQHKEYVSQVKGLLASHHTETGGEKGVTQRFTYKGKEY